MDSHIQISKFIIKNFVVSKDDGNVYIYDFRDNKVHKDGPSAIGTIPGYFDERGEDDISKKFEAPLGRIVKKLKELEKGCPDAEGITASDRKTIKRFLTELLARRPDVYIEAIKDSEPAKAFNYRPTPSHAMSNYVDEDMAERLFEGRILVVVLNRAETSFVSSVKGYAVCGKRGVQNQNWWFPLTPTLAINCVTEKVFQSVYHGENIVQLEDENSIRMTNDLIFVQSKQEYEQIIKHEGFSDYYAGVFSNDKPEIDRLAKDHANM